MIKSTWPNGHKIYAGDTALHLSTRLEQTGPLELTLRAGNYTTTDGQSFDLLKDQVIPIQLDSELEQVLLIDLGLHKGQVDVLVRLAYLDGEMPDYPANWQTLQPLVLQPGVIIPPWLGDLNVLEIEVFSVEPGFPEGTDAEYWRMQSGEVTQ